MGIYSKPVFEKNQSHLNIFVLFSLNILNFRLF